VSLCFASRSGAKLVRCASRRLLNEFCPSFPNVVSADRRACRSTAQFALRGNFPIYYRQSADRDRPGLSFSVEGPLLAQSSRSSASIRGRGPARVVVRSGAAAIARGEGYMGFGVAMGRLKAALIRGRHCAHAGIRRSTVFQKGNIAAARRRRRIPPRAAQLVAVRSHCKDTECSCHDEQKSNRLV
jgi:hypothetical protein